MKNDTKITERAVRWFKKENDDRVFSQKALRLTVGLLGLLLPIALVVYMMIRGDCEPDILPSISDYFHSKGHDVFIGVLSAVTLAFFVFRGYQVIDEVVGKIACFASIGVMSFPTEICQPNGCHLPESTSELFNALHYTSAAIFFLCLAVFSLFLFPLSYKDRAPLEMTTRMKWRKRIYISCGVLILGSMVVILVFSRLPGKLHDVYVPLNPVFWLEVIMLLAFSISWLTKSHFLWADEDLPLHSMIAVD